MVRPILTLAFTLTACSAWKPTELPAPAQPLAGKPQYVRLVLSDSSVMVLSSPSITGDTLIGNVDLRHNASAGRVKVPVAQIKSIEVLKRNPLRMTVGIIAFALLTIGGIYVLLATHPYT